MYALATLTRKFAEIERLPAFRNVREQHIHEGVLAVERRTTPILQRDNLFDRREVTLAERVVLLAKKTLPLAIASRLGPIGHDAPTDETYHLLIPIPTVKHQSTSVVRAIIDGKLGELHNPYPSVGSRSFRFECGRFFNSASVFLESTLQAPPSLSHRAMAAMCWLASV